jgi:hypothetical protein
MRVTPNDDIFLFFLHADPSSKPLSHRMVQNTCIAYCTYVHIGLLGVLDDPPPPNVYRVTPAVYRVYTTMLDHACCAQLGFISSLLLALHFA